MSRDGPQTHFAPVPRPVRAQAILDAGALEAALAGSGAQGGGREGLLAVLRDHYEAGMAEIRRRRDAGGTGRRAAEERAWLVDGILRALFRHATERLYPVANPTDAEHLALAATGGYGRGLLAPHSDIDILFLHPYRLTGWHERVIETVVYTLWDLGLKVGHAVRRPQEALKFARGDIHARTALLDLRPVAGEEALVADLITVFRRRLVRRTGPDFVEAKLAERDRRHARFGDSRYVVEPHLKEGKGGLRDLHTLYWIVDHLYGLKDPRAMAAAGILSEAEARAMQRAENFFWTVRVDLHFLQGRAEERLTFDVQPMLAARLGYRDRGGLKGVERFMKHYFLHAKTVGELTRIVCALLEEREQKRWWEATWERLPFRRSVEGFAVLGRRLGFRDPDEPARSPRRMIEIFAAAQRSGLDIHPDALRVMRRHLKRIDARLRADPRANAAFLDVLMARAHPEVNLRRMNEAGVLGRFIPEFGRIVAQMQYNMYHHYTVDEHLIRAVGYLAAIERGELEDEHPLSSEVVHKIKLRRALYLAVFLHDIAKGRYGDHSEIGARIALKLGPRLGLTPAETELAAWLVEHHLLMSATAFQRDLSDPKTVEDFAAVVSSIERLRQLLVLTVADIRAVGPGVWNSWKAALLRELYWRTEERLIAGHAGSSRRERVAARQERLLAALTDWPAALKERLGREFPDSYWIAEDHAALLTHARLMRPFLERLAAGERPGGTEEVAIALEEDKKARALIVSVVTPDRPGLFARLAAAFARAGVSVIGAQIHTSRQGLAVDSFRVVLSEDRAAERRMREEALAETIRRMLAAPELPGEDEVRRQPMRQLARRMRAFRVEPLVLIDNAASRRATVIEINAADRPGLLYALARALHEAGLDIRSAHVSTYGERAVDVFYVTESDGAKVEGALRLAEIEERLLAAARGGLRQAA